MTLPLTAYYCLDKAISLDRKELVGSFSEIGYHLALAVKKSGCLKEVEGGIVSGRTE